MLIHPFVHAWRKVGPAIAYAIVVSILTALATTAFRSRETWLGLDFGTNYVFMAVGLVAFSVLAWFGLAFGRRMPHLDSATRIGVAELRNVGRPEALVRDGLYGAVRHPIYAIGLVMGVAFALIVNHLGIYVLAALALPVLYVVTLLEERELVERFGEVYRQYQRKVPRLVPHWKQPRRGA